MTKEKTIPDVLIPRSPSNKKQKIMNQIPSSFVVNKSPKDEVSLSTTTNDLPDEIVVEILIRLPVKSVIRFTSICKSWKALIYDPDLVKRHLHLSAKDTSLRSRQIIVNYPKFRSYSLNSLYTEEISEATSKLDADSLKKKPPPPPQPPRLWLRRKHPPVDYPIIGSCSGLICIFIDKNTVCLWNPSIRKVKMLPHLDTEIFTKFGFGYDVLNDDYKVVSVYSYAKSLLVKVYSLSANCWKTIGELPYPIFLYGPGVHVNGTLNWDATYHTDHLSHVIQSFDLAKETFFEVPQPDFNDRNFIMLGQLRDCLCILRYYHGTRTDVWIMSEYGVKDSWNILVSIPDELVVARLPFKVSVPLYISERF